MSGLHTRAAAREDDAPMPTPVIIDCDPGHDDAMALLLALGSPELEVAAVTTVAGNQTLEKVTANAIRVLDVAGAHAIPVAAGADRPLVHPARVAAEVHGETGLDGPELPPPSREPEPVHAVELMARLLRERPLTLVAVGPLTNVALLLALHPELTARIERIVLMGGASPTATSPRRPSSTSGAMPRPRSACSAPALDVTMVGLDVTHRALPCADRAEGLRASGRAGAFVADLHAFYRRFHASIYGDPSTPVHDALAVALADPPGPAAVRAAARGGRHVAGPVPRAHRRRPLRRTGLEPNARVAVDVDGAAFIDLLCERIARPAVTFPFQRPLGAVPLRSGRTEFRVWAPGKQVSVRLGDRDVPMEDAGYGVSEVVLDAGEGDDYRFVVDGEAHPDPCSRWQPEGIRGPSRIVDPLGFPGPTSTSACPASRTPSSTSSTSARSRPRARSTAPSGTCASWPISG